MGEIARLFEPAFENIDRAITAVRDCYIEAEKARCAAEKAEDMAREAEEIAEKLRKRKQLLESW